MSLKPLNKQTIIFDIDGIIAKKTTDGDYSKAEPLWHGIEQVNKVYDLGYTVVLLTARYGDRCKGNVNEQYSRGYVELVTWLEKHGVKYTSCYMGKVAGAIYVDDKAVRVDEDTEKGWSFFWKELGEIDKKDKYGNYIGEDYVS